MTSPAPALPFPEARRALHDVAGVTWGHVPAGPDTTAPVPRSYGSPSSEYRSALDHAVAIDRTDRGLLRVFGRDPVKMIHGLVSNDVAALGTGESVYALMLNPKGRMLADLRVIRRESDLLLEADVAALPAIRQNLTHYVPPLFARFEDVSDAFAVVGIYGPSCDEVLQAASAALSADTGMLLLRTDHAGVPGIDAVVPAAAFAGFWSALVEAGSARAGHAALDVLRIEAGMPRWGAELDETVIPLEAGLGERAISATKGCYTGQEVIIRILHRGHVNRHLRGLLLGEQPAPQRGAELFRAGELKAVGRITSSCLSPRLSQTIALAYLRRELEPGTTVRIDSPEGAEGRVVALPFTGPAGEPAADSTQPPDHP